MRKVFTVVLVLAALSRPLSAAASDFYSVTDADKKFLTEIVDVMRKNDAAWIASHMVYPLSLVASNHTRVMKTKEEFTPVLAQKLTESVRAKIAGDAEKPLFKNWQGVMIGDGILWFSEYQHAGDKSWRYGIFAIGYFAFQPEDALRPKEGANL